MEFLPLSGGDSILADPEEFAEHNDTEFDQLFLIYANRMAETLGDGSTDLWTTFVNVTSPRHKNATSPGPGPDLEAWTDADREALLSRYLGFPLWDGMIFPTVALTEVPQLTPIGVSRFSPLMASTLTAPDAGGKLKGIPLKHFGGFLKKRGVARK